MNTKQLIEKYHQAWTNGDFLTARDCLSDSLDFRGSIDTFSKADDFIAALQQFKQMLKGVTILNSYYDTNGAALLYDCDSASPAGVIRTAEFFTVVDNKISAIQLIFDATELRKLMPT
ncbi:MAG: nuclear transport factor 2 family protein [Chlorobium sp.]|jgi:SnoaL-like domain|nr:MAG: nuclear transport factor 2 family protein [Chlorobium sp.]